MSRERLAKDSVFINLLNLLNVHTQMLTTRLNEDPSVETSKFSLYFSGSCIPINRKLFYFWHYLPCKINNNIDDINLG